jgi:DNA-binding transcriptional ArsR family regulator
VIRSIRDIFTTSRTKILSRLETRPHTVSELSKTTGYSKSTLSYHLEKLSEMGMVKRIENGRKWVYYELTEKGKRAIKNDFVRLLGIFTGSVVSFLAAAYRALTMYQPVLDKAYEITRAPSKPETVPAPQVVPSSTKTPEFEVTAYIFDPVLSCLIVLGAFLMFLFVIYKRRI